MESIPTHGRKPQLCYKFLSSLFNKDTYPFDFIKPNVIWKLNFKVKYKCQVNGGLIMFFENSRIRFFKISWLDYEQYGKNQYKKKNTINIQFNLQRVKIIFKECQKTIGIILLCFIFLFCGEKSHDNKEFSRENSKPGRESRITIRQVEP